LSARRGTSVAGEEERKRGEEGEDKEDWKRRREER
jgi:hypothetical protein